MARTTSMKYRLTVLARSGELTLVDFAHYLEGEPVGAERLTGMSVGPFVF